MDIDQLITTPLSPEQIRGLWISNPLTKSKSVPPVVMYDTIIRAKSLSSIFGGHDSIILFYPNAQIGADLMGHYVAIVKHPQGVQFYDPYGYKPDSKQKHTPQRDSLYAEEQNSLIKHFLSHGEPVDYSHHKHQSVKEGVATCGRHSMMRCLYEDLTNDEYNRTIRGLCKALGINPDMLVALIFS
ncbi:MAG: hypothetical protein Salg2KO_10310 [Salibacteraceae bacterium]